MPTVVKTFSFTSDAEGLADVARAADITFSHEPADGSPASGCVKFVGVNVGSTQAEDGLRPTTGQTWETWGVPPGGVVMEIQITAWKYKLASASDGALYNHRLWVTVFDSTGVINGQVTGAGNYLLNGVFLGEVVGGWAAQAAGPLRTVIATRRASTTDVRLWIEYQIVFIAVAVSTDARFDTIELTITYTAPIAPAGIASGEAFGTATIWQDATADGVASGEAFGVAVAGQSIAIADGVPSGETFSVPSASPVVTAGGIASEETIGDALVEIVPIRILPTGLVSEGAFGLAMSGQIFRPAGIPGGEAFEMPLVGDFSILPSARLPTGVLGGMRPTRVTGGSD